MSKPTTDPNEIRQWAESRGGKPAAVKATEGDEQSGEMIRLMFPDSAQSEDSDLEEISWDEWFEQFEANDLALLYEDETTDGSPSQFNKLVSR